MIYDVAVIGAGIQGVGVAQAAAAAGYSVVVLEKNAPASGTSCKSSKLIHGGLRYLESGQFKLVHECLHERALLLKNAPELVKLKPFYIPIYNDTSRQPWKIQVGLSLYKALAGFDASSRYKRLLKSEWSELDNLETQGLKAVFQYWDAQTDDALLTKAVLLSAESLGVELRCPAKLFACEKTGEAWRLTCRESDIEKRIEAKVVVNATGPWVNEVLQSINPEFIEYSVDLVQGTHIILPIKTNKGIYYLEAPSDRRAVFVMPWGEQTMIGTTEKLFAGSPDEVMPSEEEILYLLETVAHYFPELSHFKKEDVVASFAGLRVLPGEGDSAFSKARDTMIYENAARAPGLITLYGGKLTAYRATAEQVLAKLKPYLPQRDPIADTRSLRLLLG